MTGAGERKLDDIFTALADPGRRGMVDRLSIGPATVKELAEPAGMGLPSALKHLRVLEKGGIVVSTKAGRTRTYRIDPAAFGAINAWVRQREAAMNAAFDRLVAAIAESPEGEDDTCALHTTPPSWSNASCLQGRSMRSASGRTRR